MKNTWLLWGEFLVCWNSLQNRLQNKGFTRIGVQKRIFSCSDCNQHYSIHPYYGFWAYGAIIYGGKGPHLCQNPCFVFYSLQSEVNTTVQSAMTLTYKLCPYSGQIIQQPPLMHCFEIRQSSSSVEQYIFQVSHDHSLVGQWQLNLN